MSPPPPTIDQDTIIRLLSDSRRRHVLQQLMESETVDVEDLADQIAVAETHDPTPSAYSDEKEHVMISLVHNHLPRLEEHEVVKYDQESQETVRGENFEAVIEYLELLEQGGPFSEILVVSSLSSSS